MYNIYFYKLLLLLYVVICYCHIRLIMINQQIGENQIGRGIRLYSKVHNYLDIMDGRGYKPRQRKPWGLVR